jgi:hypothetical protein
MLSLLTMKASNDINSLMLTPMHIVISQYKVMIENLKKENAEGNKQSDKARKAFPSQSTSFKTPNMQLPKIR